MGEIGLRRGKRTMNTVLFGWVELAIGIAGIVLGMMGKMSRASVIISVGLLLFGISHFLSKHLYGFVNDAGALVVLFGIGMSISFMFRHRKQ
jgi:CHASE2 domain-containing sensor protein